MAESISLAEKTNSINGPRYGCALGAFHSVVAIPGAVPITHCGPGCVDKQQTSFALSNGCQGASGSVIPSVNAGENEVVFGGENKLRNLIKGTLKILKGDLFVVLSGCIGELVGDDVAAVVGEFQKKDVPIVYAETGGFKGNNLIGHEIVVKAIIDQFVGDYYGEKTKGTVNVWSDIPYFNTFWRGDLIEIKRLLEGIGLKVNILFGYESKGVREWKNIPKAEFNLVISPWVGLSIAQHLEQKYNQPFLHIPVPPIGGEATSAFLRKVAEFSSTNLKKAEKFIKTEEKKYYSFIENFSEFYSESFYGLPAKYVVIGDSLYNLALHNFLSNQMGLIPTKQIITDNPPDKYKPLIIKENNNIQNDFATELEFIEDGYTVINKIKEIDFSGQLPLILGTSWEKSVSRELNAVLVQTSFPVSSEVVLTRSYIGYKGALELIEKIYSTSMSMIP
ncbi:MAG: nitrogenase component 1 [Bacillota bacterium]|nr:nitrogenase component 1 [Bacillota bacterium]